MQNGPSIQNILEPVTLKPRKVLPPISGDDRHSPSKHDRPASARMDHPASARNDRPPSARNDRPASARNEKLHVVNAIEPETLIEAAAVSVPFGSFSGKSIEIDESVSPIRQMEPDTTDAVTVDTTEDQGHGKLKYKEGKYKLGKKQFVANKYLYVPAKLMLQPGFSFAEIFPKVFGTAPPSIMFIINRGISTSTWNLKLPQSRRYLHDVYKVATPIPRRDNMRNKTVDYSSMLDSHSYLKYIPGTIEHYQSVIAENCKRLLRAQYTALTQAQAVYRVHEIWSDEFDEDVVAQWVQESAPKGPYRTPSIYGVADRSDFHDDVWAQLRDGAHDDYEQLIKDGREPDEVIIDPKPFFSGKIKVEYDKRTGHPTKSIPHPALTHLIISDHRQLLEQKLAETTPWGVILMNGGIKSAELAVLAVQLGLPLVCYKFTGGTADVVIEMLDKIEKWVVAKKLQELNVQDVPPRPYPDDMCPGYQHPGWLYAFDEIYVSSCNMMNVLVENWPDRFNKESVFIVDMFTTTEDEVQDRITQTIAVVSAGEYELGGSAAEERRLSYAMRIRHKFMYNASLFLIISDFITAIQILFGMMSTLIAVGYGIYGIGYFVDVQISWRYDPAILATLHKFNLLLPLTVTVFRGIIAALGPYMKYVALKNASVQVEGEVYAFRCKVGKYSVIKQSEDDDEDGGKDGKGKKKKKKKKKEENKEGDGDKDKGDAAAGGGPNPRKAFQESLDRIWKQLAASDISNGSLMVPRFTSPTAALEDINHRIRSNRATQDAWAVPMMFGSPDTKKKDDAEGNLDDEEEDESGGGCLNCGSIATSGKQADMHHILYDDGITMLSPEEYVLIRVNPMAAYYAAKSPSLHVVFCLFAVIANILSILATVLASLSALPLIPVVNAVGESFHAYDNYKQTQLRLMQTNLALNQLNEMLVYWDSLTVIEKRVPAHVELLVKKTEAIIRAQATIFQSGGGDGGGDDDGKEGKGDE